jgi:hypothetical protein
VYSSIHISDPGSSTSCRPRLPAGEPSALRIGELGHPAVLADLEGVDPHLAARAADLRGGRFQVGGSEVDHPGRLRALVERAESGDGLAVDLEEAVLLVRRVPWLETPAEDSAVELLGGGGVPDAEVDPAGGAHGEVGGDHRDSLQQS